MPFVRGAHGANQLGVGITKKSNRVRIQRNVRPVLLAVAGHAFEKLFAFLRRIDADAEDLDFSFEIALPLINEGRHLGPTPGSPAAAVEKDDGCWRIPEDSGEFDSRAVDIF